ncbi:MAG: FHA domain-containing protein [Pirellulaceae bacterium]
MSAPVFVNRDGRMTLRDQWLAIFKALVARDWRRAAEVASHPTVKSTKAGRRVGKWLVRPLMKQVGREWRNAQFANSHELWQLTRKLANAKQLDTIHECWRQLVDHSIHEAEQKLRVGNVDSAYSILGQLSEINALDWRVDGLFEVTRAIANANQLAEAGQLESAEARYLLAIQRKPELLFVSAAIERIRNQMNGTRARTPIRQPVWSGPNGLTVQEKLLSNSETNSRGMSTSSVMMWIDGVGSYLICFAAENWIGKHVAEPRCQIPLQGDLFRYHARLAFDSQGLQILPEGDVWINARRLNVKQANLKDGDRVSLGAGNTRFLVELPEYGGAARLSLEHGNRTWFGCDQILLVRDVLTIGNSRLCDIRIPGVSEQFEIRKGKNSVCIESPNEFAIDGRLTRGPVPLSTESRLTSRDLAIQFETTKKLVNR